MLKKYKNSSELLRVNLDTSIHWSSHKIAMDNLFLLSLQGPHMKVDGGTSLHPVAYDSERSLLLYHCTMRVRWPSTYEQHERIYIITGVWFQRIHHITDVPKRWGNSQRHFTSPAITRRILWNMPALLYSKTPASTAYSRLIQGITGEDLSRASSVTTIFLSTNNSKWQLHQYQEAKSENKRGGKSEVDEEDHDVANI